MGCMAALDAERYLAEHHEAGAPAPDAAQIEPVTA
jgi:thioredoxin reductase (NADPH)